MHTKVAQDCPLCFSKDSFQSWKILKDSLVSLSTRTFACPLGCPGIHEGLDKFALHLVSHEMEQKNLQHFQNQEQLHTLEGYSPSEDIMMQSSTLLVKEKQELITKNELCDPVPLCISNPPTISIKEQSMDSANHSAVSNKCNIVDTSQTNQIDPLDELLADFSEFVKQEDKKQSPVQTITSMVNHQAAGNYNSQVQLKPESPNPMRTNPKLKTQLGSPSSNNGAISQQQRLEFGTSQPYPNIQTPLPMSQSQINAMHQQQMKHLPTNNMKTLPSPPPLLLHGAPNNIMATLSSPNDMQQNPAFGSIQVPMPLKLSGKPMPSAPPSTPKTPGTMPRSPGAKASSNKSPNTSNPQSPNTDNVDTTKEQSSGGPKQVQCQMCGWNFDNESFLQLHIVLMHSKRNQAILQRRVRRVVEDYKCRDCNNASFKVYEEYVNHLRLVHNDHRFVCHICAKIFKLRGSLLVHLRVVHNPMGDGGYHCKVCNRKFTNKHRRDVHEMKHTDTRQFECAKCGMSFEEKSEFEVHMETHKTEHKCTLCSRTFYTQAALLIHTIGHQKTTMQASTTEKSQSNTEQGLAHLFPKAQNSLNQQRAPCTQKTDGMSNQDDNLGDSDARRHLEMHGYKCTVCEKVFKRESHLNQHSKVHDNKEWECDVCKKTFTTKYFLKKHNRLHTGSRHKPNTV